MGNIFDLEGVKRERVYSTHITIRILTDIGMQMEDPDYKLNTSFVKSLYKQFYYPTDPLTKVIEMDSNHFLLHKILKRNIKMFNKYNSPIDEATYIENTYKSLKKTLHVIGL
jgi:hypothetical protein